MASGVRKHLQAFFRAGTERKARRAAEKSRLNELNDLIARLGTSVTKRSFARFAKEVLEGNAMFGAKAGKEWDRSVLERAFQMHAGMSVEQVIGFIKDNEPYLRKKLRI